MRVLARILDHDEEKQIRARYAEKNLLIVPFFLNSPDFWYTVFFAILGSARNEICFQKGARFERSGDLPDLMARIGIFSVEESGGLFSSSRFGEVVYLDELKGGINRPLDLITCRTSEPVSGSTDSGAQAGRRDTGSLTTALVSPVRIPDRPSFPSGPGAMRAQWMGPSGICAISSISISSILPLKIYRRTPNPSRIYYSKTLRGKHNIYKSRNTTSFLQLHNTTNLKNGEKVYKSRFQMLTHSPDFSSGRETLVRIRSALRSGK